MTFFGTFPGIFLQLYITEKTGKVFYQVLMLNSLLVLTMIVGIAIAIIIISHKQMLGEDLLISPNYCPT
jgi:uncharacterized membrane protein YdjX (TVP38/TMEM64 family)